MKPLKYRGVQETQALLHDRKVEVVLSIQNFCKDYLTILTLVVLVTSFALVANDSVLRDCSTWLNAGLKVHIIAVLAFPPSEDCNIRVSFDSLYGI